MLMADWCSAIGCAILCTVIQDVPVLQLTQSWHRGSSCEQYILLLHVLMIRSCPHICCSCKECRSGLLCQTRVTAQKQCSLVIYVLTHTASCYSVLLSPSGGRGFAISCLRDFCINHHMPGYACVTDICVHSVHA